MTGRRARQDRTEVPVAGEQGGMDSVGIGPNTMGMGDSENDFVP